MPPLTRPIYKRAVPIEPLRIFSLLFTASGGILSAELKQSYFTLVSAARLANSAENLKASVSTCVYVWVYTVYVRVRVFILTWPRWICSTVTCSTAWSWHGLDAAGLDLHVLHRGQPAPQGRLSHPERALVLVRESEGLEEHVALGASWKQVHDKAACWCFQRAANGRKAGTSRRYTNTGHSRSTRWSSKIRFTSTEI